MPTLDKVKAEDAPVHLLLIGDTKAGKSTYAAEAAIDGFEVIYLDSDNGLSALRARIMQEANSDEILKRVNYFAPRNPVQFAQDFLRSSAKNPLFWIPSQGKKAPKVPAALNKMAEETPDAEVWIIDYTAVPKTAVLCFDSWTSLAMDGLKLLRPEQLSSLLENDGQADQSLYGEARVGLVYISNLLQQAHCHVLVQAHGTRYEVWKKPDGTSGRVKQSELTLQETIEIPVSSSRPHGLEMGSRFNHIGWLSVNSLGIPEVDFTRKPGRVGGGPPNKKAKTRDLRFKDLVGEVPTPHDPGRPWYQETTLKELAEAVGKESKIRGK